jgi:hypothetical protein
MPKLTVITNSAGEIVGTADYTREQGAPTMARLIGGPDTTVQEIDVADDVLRLSPSERHLKLQEILSSTMQPMK